MIDVKQNIEQQNEYLDSSSEDSNTNKMQKPVTRYRGGNRSI